MPACDRIAGLTKTMYAIVRNVATPPSTSVRTDDPRSEMANSRSSIPPDASAASGGNEGPLLDQRLVTSRANVSKTST